MMTAAKAQRWCIYIDLLGFSQWWERQEMKAIGSLRELMQAIYRIGTRLYPNEGERLFVHQMGDGFAILSDFGEASLERPISIATALMRCVAITGTFAAAAIAEGEFADITGYYPPDVTRDLDGAHAVRLGAGLMTLSSVMGTAFIRAYRLNSDSPPGPLVIVSSSNRDRIPLDLPIRTTRSRKGTELLSIDWIHANTTSLRRIQQHAGLSTPTEDDLIQALKTYFVQNKDLGDKWGHIPALLDVK
jgi:hypothetical protein